MTDLPYTVRQHNDDGSVTQLAAFLSAYDAYRFVKAECGPSAAVHSGNAMWKRCLVVAMKPGDFVNLCIEARCRAA